MRAYVHIGVYTVYVLEVLYMQFGKLVAAQTIQIH